MLNSLDKIFKKKGQYDDRTDLLYNKLINFKLKLVALYLPLLETV